MFIEVLNGIFSIIVFPGLVFLVALGFSHST